MVTKRDTDHWVVKVYRPEVLCIVCWRMKIRSDPSAKCVITMLKLKLLTAHALSQYLGPMIVEAAVYLRTVCLGMTGRQQTALSKGIHFFYLYGVTLPVLLEKL